MGSATQQKATDPIQQLFVDKINEYSTKKTKAGRCLHPIVDLIVTNRTRGEERIPRLFAVV